MLIHFNFMKRRLSVRAFKEYINSGEALNFRAFNPTWKKLFPADAKIAQVLKREEQYKFSRDRYAEALFLHDGDEVAASLHLIKQMIAPPSFTALSSCSTCGILPAKPNPSGAEPSCAWCGIISLEQELQT
jgi:hypothetical protein